jgi:C-terminal processing protease CtpA/Prc
MDYGDMTGRDRWKTALEVEDELHLARPRYKELGDNLTILKLPTLFQPADSIEGIIERARNHSTLIVDLRGNPGGAEASLQALVGGVFDRDMKIADRLTRDNRKPLMAKGAHKPFAGKLIVLVDAESASASELFARVVQIDKRGVVLGDRTAGRVMDARLCKHQTGTSPVYNYANSISVADVVMNDGKSLEHLGVIPDEMILPTASDLAVHRDPVLAEAVKMAGGTLTPEEAGNLFPYEWPKP